MEKFNFANLPELVRFEPAQKPWQSGFYATTTGGDATLVNTWLTCYAEEGTVTDYLEYWDADKQLWCSCNHDGSFVVLRNQERIWVGLAAPWDGTEVASCG